jgi:hypothetical protein
MVEMTMGYEDAKKLNSNCFNGGLQDMILVIARIEKNAFIAID